jgi:hypothetical protein
MRVFIYLTCNINGQNLRNVRRRRVVYTLPLDRRATHRCVRHRLKSHPNRLLRGCVSLRRYRALANFLCRSLVLRSLRRRGQYLLPGCSQFHDPDVGLCLGRSYGGSPGKWCLWPHNGYSICSCAQLRSGSVLSCDRDSGAIWEENETQTMFAFIPRLP